MDYKIIAKNTFPEMKLHLFKIAFLIFSLLVSLASCKKEVIVEEYLRCGNNLALGQDGNLIIAGYNTSSSKGYEGTLILADKSNGDTLWSHKYGDTYADAFFNVQKSHQGGYIATGFSNKSSTGSPAMWVVITDVNGTQIKSLKFGGSSYSQGFSVVPHTNADSGYLVAGYIQSSASSDRDIYLVRIDNSGTQLWDKRIGSKSKAASDTVNDAAFSIITAPDGGYFLTGSLKGYTGGGGKVFLMKVSSTGDSLWTKTYDYGVGYSLTLTKDLGIAIGGSLQNTTNQNIFILKTDTAGNVLWNETYGGSGYEYGASMVETSDGGFAITGITSSEGAGYEDIYLIRTNAAGVKLWGKSYGGSNVDQGYGLLQMSEDEGFCITGLSNSGGSYIYLNRTDKDGNELWFKNIK